MENILNNLIFDVTVRRVSDNYLIFSDTIDLGTYEPTNEKQFLDNLNQSKLLEGESVTSYFYVGTEQYKIIAKKVLDSE